MSGPTGGPLDVVRRTDPPASSINDSIVALTSVGAGGLAVLFAVSLVTGASLVVYGGSLAGSLLLLSVAVRRYFVGRYPDIIAVEPRVQLGEEDPDEPLAEVEAVGGRRTFLTRMLIGSASLVGVSLATLLGSLGPAPGDTLRRTRWAKGVRLVTGDGQPVRPVDVAEGGIATIWPQGGVAHERSAVVLIRLRQPAQSPTRLDWVVDDLVAYSKVCTHAGCPVALYRERDNALFCPCHQSTFAASQGAVPTFGPAARALPQLPLGTDSAGYLIALSDFGAQVGPALPGGS